MPLQRARQPAAQREARGKNEIEDGRGVVDLPAREHHHQDAKRVDPMRDAHRQRVDSNRAVRHRGKDRGNARIIDTLSPNFAKEHQEMTYVVTEACIKCKHMDCIEVCPVDCFYEGANMLVIHPDECIDCGVCEPECPPKAIVPDSDGQAEKWLKLNADYSVKWPNITRKGTP